jgi:hypothetical protein
MINVDVMQPSGLFDDLHSTIKISRCLDKPYLCNGKAFGKVVAATSTSGIRKLDGNHGSLHTYGMHRHNGVFKTFADTLLLKQDIHIYKNFVDSVMEMAEHYFPIELSVMIQSEYSRGITSYLDNHPCNSLISKREGPCSISTSINFATPQHVDVRDGSSSIFGWFHIGNPITNRYFLMSNLKIDIHGRVYTGLAVKLVDGLLVAGDGHIICHGTTASEFDGSIFGIQFAANGISMSSKMEVND